MTNRKILYGYQIRDGALAIVPEEQQVVRMVFTLYNAGASYQNISDALNRQNIPFSPEAPLWNKHKVKRVLKNTRYIGKDGYPVMIDESDFQAVQEKISDNIRKCWATARARTASRRSCRRKPQSSAASIAGIWTAAR